MGMLRCISLSHAHFFLHVFPCIVYSIDSMGMLRCISLSHAHFFLHVFPCTVYSIDSIDVSACFTSLGVVTDFTRVQEGVILMHVSQERVEKLVDLLEGLLEDREMPPAIAAHLCGKLAFTLSCGRLAGSRPGVPATAVRRTRHGLHGGGRCVTQLPHTPAACHPTAHNPRRSERGSADAALDRWVL